MAEQVVTDHPAGGPSPLSLTAIERQHVPANGKGLVMELLTLLRATRAVLAKARELPIRARRPTLLAEIDAVLSQAVE